MSKTYTLSILVLIMFLLMGCKPQFTQKDQFKFLVFSDIHLSTNLSHENRLQEFVEKFNLDDNINNDIDFIVTTGDNASFVYSNKNSNTDSIANNHLLKYIDIMSNLKVPVYSCMGNHEYKIDKNRDSDGFFPESEILEMEKIWKKETGLDPYYAIKQGNFNLIFLNSMRGRFQNRFFDDDQMIWLETQLADSDNVILFFHHPINTDNIEYWYKKKEGTITPKVEPKFYDILFNNKEKVKTVFVGHGHKWITDKLFGLINVYETASFGDNEDFMYYKVDVNKEGIKIEKSFDQPFFGGFKF